eukprot:jgi/Botrbrau1/10511/Bobra.0133s0111.1
MIYKAIKKQSYQAPAIPTANGEASPGLKGKAPGVPALQQGVLATPNKASLVGELPTPTVLKEREPRSALFPSRRRHLGGRDPASGDPGPQLEDPNRKRLFLDSSSRQSKGRRLNPPRTCRDRPIVVVPPAAKPKPNSARRLARTPVLVEIIDLTGTSQGTESSVSNSTDGECQPLSHGNPNSTLEERPAVLARNTPQAGPLCEVRTLGSAGKAVGAGGMKQRRAADALPRLQQQGLLTEEPDVIPVGPKDKPVNAQLDSNCSQSATRGAVQRMGPCVSTREKLLRGSVLLPVSSRSGSPVAPLREGTPDGTRCTEVQHTSNEALVPAIHPTKKRGKNANPTIKAGPRLEPSPSGTDASEDTRMPTKPGRAHPSASKPISDSQEPEGRRYPKRTAPAEAPAPPPKRPRKASPSISKSATLGTTESSSLDTVSIQTHHPAQSLDCCGPSRRLRLQDCKLAKRIGLVDHGEPGPRKGPARGRGGAQKGRAPGGTPDGQNLWEVVPEVEQRTLHTFCPGNEPYRKLGIAVNLTETGDPQHMRATQSTSQRFFDILRRMVVMEDERAESMKGCNASGKAISRRPDVKARTYMEENGMCINHEERPLGHVPGIPVGHKCFLRAEAACLGLHFVPVAGIDTHKILIAKNFTKGKQEVVTVARSIVASGCYQDNEDKGDELIYTGEGGNDLLGNKLQFKDQLLKAGNKALVENIRLGIPVRVLRKQEDPDSPRKDQVGLRVRWPVPCGSLVV